jgi:hypothetical protein
MKKDEGLKALLTTGQQAIPFVDAPGPSELVWSEYVSLHSILQLISEKAPSIEGASVI